MLSGFVRYLRLTAKAKTGLSPAVVVFAVVAAIGAATTFILVVFTAFVWLQQYYRSALTAALILCAFFMLVTILAGIGVVVAQRRTVERAKLALQARANTPWLDPAMLGVVLQIGRNIGLRRIVPLVAAGVLAAGFAKEWLRERPADDTAAGEES